MRKYLIDPNQKWVKANLHCHTTNSDGEKTPEEIKEYYKAHGYQVVAFTDHEQFYDNYYLTDEEFVALTAAEYGFHRRDWKPVNETYREPGSKTIWRDVEVVHLNMFKKNPHDVFNFATCEEDMKPEKCKVPPQIDGYVRDLTVDSINEVIRRANAEGTLVQFNHPDWSLNDEALYLNLDGLWGFEILNYQTNLETGMSYCPLAYDQMLRVGKNVFCTMGDDNHNHEPGDYGSFGGFNYIGVNKLTYDEVFEALKAGNFYASSGPIIKSMYVEDGKIWVECSEATDIIFNGYNRTYRNYHGENLTVADFKIFGGEVYFRITVKDKYGNVAHTHAYFCDDVLKE